LYIKLSKLNIQAILILVCFLYMIVVVLDLSYTSSITLCPYFDMLQPQIY